MPNPRPAPTATPSVVACSASTEVAVTETPPSSGVEPLHAASVVFAVHGLSVTDPSDAFTLLRTTLRETVTAIAAAITPIETETDGRYADMLALSEAETSILFDAWTVPP